LSWLHMGNNVGLTDNALAALKGSKNLESLDVSDDRGISDQGLVHLSKMKNLKRLVFAGSSITPAGVENLKKSLPDINHVTHDVLPKRDKGKD
jgi:hypothetical protein